MKMAVAIIGPGLQDMSCTGPWRIGRYCCNILKYMHITLYTVSAVEYNKMRL
jgi:hypothetical protein